MVTVLVRLTVTYFVTVLSIRLMGKRQIGQLQMSELVTAFFLSELATYPVTDRSIPLSYGLLSVVTLISLEVILSFCSTKLAFVRRALDSAPTVLIRRGVLDQQELSRARLTVDELFSLLRQKDVQDIREVNYALLEPNGQLSVQKYAADSPPTCRLLGLSPEERGMCHLLIKDGEENGEGLRGAGIDRACLLRRLRREGVAAEEALFYCLDDAGQSTHVRKERR